MRESNVSSEAGNACSCRTPEFMYGFVLKGLVLYLITGTFSVLYFLLYYFINVCMASTG